MWENVKEEMRKLESLQDKACEYFELGDSAPLLVAVDIGWWCADQHSFYHGWGELDSDIEKGAVYGGDTVSIVEKEAFSLVYYDNGCGERINFVLPNSARVNDEDDIERIANV